MQKANQVQCNAITVREYMVKRPRFTCDECPAHFFQELCDGASLFVPSCQWIDETAPAETNPRLTIANKSGSC
jgi:hypothetical protein